MDYSHKLQVNYIIVIFRLLRDSHLYPIYKYSLYNISSTIRAGAALLLLCERRI